jgi:hypothetical protein
VHSGRRSAWRRGGHGSGAARIAVQLAVPVALGLAANRTLLAAGQSPVTAAGDNLLAYLANRLSMSFANLGCQHFGLANPVTVTRDGAGAVIAATFTTTPRQAAAAPGAS